ncbi:hypothetical protein HDU96_007272 [Phlyctochytrium bullatum]|nr:hypothetical protein HDU96_007272 [Phlyctochytrium bullatum]
MALNRTTRVSALCLSLKRHMSLDSKGRFQPVLNILPSRKVRDTVVMWRKGKEAMAYGFILIFWWANTINLTLCLDLISPHFASNVIYFGVWLDSAEFFERAITKLLFGLKADDPAPIFENPSVIPKQHKTALRAILNRLCLTHSARTALQNAIDYALQPALRKESRRLAVADALFRNLAEKLDEAGEEYIKWIVRRLQRNDPEMLAVFAKIERFRAEVDAVMAEDLSTTPLFEDVAQEFQLDVDGDRDGSRGYVEHDRFDSGADTDDEL